MRLITWITVGLTYFMMFWGNLVSATGSGMGCGDDWPACKGTYAPTISFEVVMEWGHRILGALVSIFILTTCIKAWNHPKFKRPIRLLALAIPLYLLFQVLLGRATVILGLSLTISTIHLLLAAFIFIGLILIACVSTWDRNQISEPSPAALALSRLVAVGFIGLIIQLALGALVRHGQAGLACPSFPNCINSFWPTPFVFQTAVAFFHRWWGMIMAGLYILIMFKSKNLNPSIRKPANAVGFLAIFQVLLGIATVLDRLQVGSRSIHAAVGYLLIACLFYLGIRTGWYRSYFCESLTHKNVTDSIPSTQATSMS